MQPSAFSQEGAGGQHNFYNQAPSYGSTGGAAGGNHHASHAAYGQQHAPYGEQSYLQQGAGQHGHMGMYQGYPHYPAAHGHGASPQQHYSHVQPGFGAAGPTPQSMLSGTEFHPSQYAHMAQHGMYYHDPSSVHGMMAHPHHATVPGMMPNAMNPAHYNNPLAQHAAAQPAAAAGGKATTAKGAKGGRKDSTSGASTKKPTKKEEAAAAAAAAGGTVTAGGKAKSSKSSSSVDRHHPYAADGAPVPGTGAAEKPSKKKEKEPAKPPVLKSHLKPPKQAPSAWQVYFTEELQKIKAEQPDARLNVAHVAKDAGQRYAALPEEKKKEFKRRSDEAKEQWERDMLAWKQTLTPEDIKQENMFRTAQRKAGKSRKGNLKDPNAPKKPLSAYFLFLRAIRADSKMTEDVFHGEQETTKQSVLAAAKWRSLPEEEKQPFLEKAEADKVEYERQRKEYEQSHGLAPGTNADGTTTKDEDDAGSHEDEEGHGFDYPDDGTSTQAATTTDDDPSRWNAAATSASAGGSGGARTQQPVPPSLAAGGDDAFKLDGHFGLGEGDDLGFASGKVEGGFGLDS